MANKIHLRANKEAPGVENFARCAAQSTSNGKVRHNSRRTYSTISLSLIVSFAEFRAAHATNPSSVCSHCCDAGLIIRNSQRRAKGLLPVATLFEIDIEKQGVL